MSEHCRAARQNAGELRHVDRGEQRGNEAFRGVDENDRQAEAPAEDAPDVGSADVAAAVLADVGPLDGADEPVPGRDRAGDIPGDDGDCGSYFVSIWYFETQSLIVRQSRLSKNALMYDARSV